MAFASEWDGRPLNGPPTTATISNTSGGAGAGPNASVNAASSSSKNSPSHAADQAGSSGGSASSSTSAAATKSVLLQDRDYQELDGTVYPGDIYFGPLVKKRNQEAKEESFY